MTTSRGRRIAAILSAVVIAGYIFVTLVFVMPPGPVKSAFADVRSAASPYFTQKWNVFAPNIAKTNPELRIQAQWRDESGELIKSDWVSMTELEFRSIPGNLLPSRIHKSSWNAQSSYLRRYNQMNDEQKAVIRDTFIERHDGGYRAKPPVKLINELSDLGESRSQVTNLLRYDYMLKEYATYFATAYFDKEIERVRWAVHRERPNDFEHRFDPVQQFESTTLRFGWRHADDPIHPEALAVYDEVIDRYGQR